MSWNRWPSAVEYPLNANDAIRCKIREEQSLSATTLVKTLFIEEVLDHRPGARQLTLV